MAVIIKYVQSVGAIMMNMTLSQAPMGSYQKEEIQIYREKYIYISKVSKTILKWLGTCQMGKIINKI